ncbi:hypothetical protein BXZ70DRAFT_559359 [Cristinia sonorae]|uniref:Uncharacterized protein n=1 Tax=Cristinia sonorae TaxID=1940300 RepID=A0A8K0UFG3_9AGAR|nr:hypothetical protein BXZ70DRAFT_559359 [Cristinia sonorae]
MAATCPRVITARSQRHSYPAGRAMPQFFHLCPHLHPRSLPLLPSPSFWLLHLISENPSLVRRTQEALSSSNEVRRIRTTILREAGLLLGRCESLLLERAPHPGPISNLGENSIDLPSGSIAPIQAEWHAERQDLSSHLTQCTSVDHGVIIGREQRPIQRTYLSFRVRLCDIAVDLATSPTRSKRTLYESTGTSEELRVKYSQSPARIPPRRRSSGSA